MHLERVSYLTMKHHVTGIVFVLAQALAKSAHKLPKDTDKITVEGGNHRGYASYTWQPLDWEVRSRSLYWK